MSSPLSDVRATAKPSGLIDTIQAGFNAVNRNVWLLLLPLIIDLGLWLGPQLTVGPLMQNWLLHLTPPPGVSGEMVRTIEQGRQSSLQIIERDPAVGRYNLVSLLGIGVPSFRAGSPGDGPQVPLPSFPIAGAVAAVAIGLGLCLSTVFYGMLGQAVREGRATPIGFWSDFGPLLAWSASLFVLLVFAVIVLGTPVALFFATTRSTVPALDAMLWPIVAGIVLWAVVYLFFTTEAVFVSRVPPFEAVRSSVAVVRNNFWSTIGFIMLIVVIYSGLLILWKELATSLRVAGAAAAMLGHIYISSGLAAACMTYYKERFERLS